MGKKIEIFLELLIFSSRWILAPFYIGMVGAMIILLVKFVQEFLHIAPGILSSSEGEVILAVLTLIDMSLVGNLLLMVIFSGYENFVSKIDAGDHKDRPEWMGKVDYSGLKIKLITSIVAISGIELLKSFVNVNDISDRDLAWKVGIHVTFVLSGLFLALMDKIGHGTDVHS